MKVRVRLPLDLVADGNDGILCELEETGDLPRHDVAGPLGHHAHALVAVGTVVDVRTGGEVGRLL